MIGEQFSENLVAGLVLVLKPQFDKLAVWITDSNKKEEIEGRFNAITADMCSISSNADVVINTSCEHITQDQYNQWLRGLRTDSLVIVQSNNYQIDEHTL